MKRVLPSPDQAILLVLTPILIRVKFNIAHDESNSTFLVAVDRIRSFTRNNESSIINTNGQKKVYYETAFVVRSLAQFANKRITFRFTAENLITLMATELVVNSGHDDKTTPESPKTFLFSLPGSVKTNERFVISTSRSRAWSNLGDGLPLRRTHKQIQTQLSN